MLSKVENLLLKLPWSEGRQGTGYKNLRLFKKLFAWFRADCYLLYYPEESSVPAHMDQADGGKHYRLNLVLVDCKKGGDFICGDTIFKSRRLNIFRPDENLHAVFKIQDGYRLVLSVGWLR